MNNTRSFAKYGTAGPVLAALTALAVLPATANANIQRVDLTDGGPLDQGSIVADVGGTAWFALAGDETRPSGTGIFDPFLRLGTDGQGSLGDKNIEQAYNTDGRIGGQAPLDAKSDPNFTHSLQLQDLVVVSRDFGAGAQNFYVFELDAHEPDAQTKKLLSINNIRIYTAPEADGGDATTSNIDSLGTLRFAMNQPNVTSPTAPDGPPDHSVIFDASHDFSTGSGQSDLFAYIPTSAFAAANPTDFVYFYNLNGVQYAAENGTAAEATFEEWRTFTGESVPDGGSTLVLAGLAMVCLGAAQWRLKRA